jgi:hypothetical protein
METRGVMAFASASHQPPSNPETPDEAGLFEAENELEGSHDDEDERGGRRVLGVFEVDVSTYRFTCLPVSLTVQLLGFCDYCAYYHLGLTIQEWMDTFDSSPFDPYFERKSKKKQKT